MNQRRRIGPGSRLCYEGELVEIVEIRTGGPGNIATVKTVGTEQFRGIALRELLAYRHSHPYDEAVPTDQSRGPRDVAATVLAMLNKEERNRIRERAGHIREVLTGCRSGHEATAEPGEPRPEYHPDLPLVARYHAKAAELGVDLRTVQRMVAAFTEHGEAGLANPKTLRVQNAPGVDARWWEAALEIMVVSVVT